MKKILLIVFIYMNISAQEEIIKKVNAVKSYYKISRDLIKAHYKIVVIKELLGSNEDIDRIEMFIRRLILWHFKEPPFLIS